MLTLELCQTQQNKAALAWWHLGNLTQRWKSSGKRRKNEGRMGWVGDRQCKVYNPLTGIAFGLRYGWQWTSLHANPYFISSTSHTWKTTKSTPLPISTTYCIAFFYFFKFSSELIFYLTLISVAFSPKQLRTLNIRCLIWCHSGSASNLWELTEELELEVLPLQSSPRSSWAHKPTEQAGRFAVWHKNFLLPPPPPLYRTGRCEQRNPRVAN